MNRRWPRAMFLVLLAMTAARSGVAQRTGFVLHRPIPGDLPLSPENRAVAPGSNRDELRNAAGPNASWSGPQPVSDDVARPRGSWDAPTRELDRQTRSPDGTRLRYHEVFTPAVAPFKRLQAYDAIDEMGRLTVRDPSLRPVRVGENRQGAREPRARFVGELLVELSPAWPTPIPGVAGEETVISYATNTGESVEFASDSAGNLFARGVHPGTVRLTYVLEAPEHAFSAPSMPNLPVAAAAAEVPMSLRPLVPSWLLAAAEPVLRRVGVSRGDPFDAALGRLVGHFRAFRDAELGDARGVDLYSDLALGGVGACRHRAYALVPTLHALGIPARYVGNEAHAWVEVFVTRVGWTRVDLGGWDVPLDANAASERPAFRPSNSDPFPQPANYRSGYSYVTGAASSVQSRGAPGSVDPNAVPSASASGGTQAGDGGSDGGANDPTAAGTSTNITGALPNDRRAAQSPATSGTNGPTGTDSASGGARASPRRDADPADDEADVQLPVTLEVREVRGDEHAGYATQHGYVRGSMVHVSGDVADDQRRAVGGLVVQVQLVRGGVIVGRLGTTVSRPDGSWEARVQLPEALNAGAYEIRAFTPGDSRHASASGD